MTYMFTKTNPSNITEFKTQSLGHVHFWLKTTTFCVCMFFYMETVRKNDKNAKKRKRSPSVTPASSGVASTR